MQGARALRSVAAACWVVHSLFWSHYGNAAWLQPALAGLVLSGYLARRWLTRRWAPRVLAAAAVLVMVSEPADLAVGKAQSAPAGLVAILGSFLLFGLGTATALTRHRWHRRPSE